MGGQVHGEITRNIHRELNGWRNRTVLIDGMHHRLLLTPSITHAVK
jgi:hypothetical protein